MTDEKAGPDELRKLFEVWVDSELKARIILFYNNNPGVVETMEGLAQRLGTTVDALRKDIAAHVELGLLRERTVGGKTILLYDRKRRNDIESFVTKELQRRQRGDE